MPVMTERNSKVVTVRLPLDMVERIESFAAETEMTMSGALRTLIELGTDVEVDMAELRSIQFNANAVALRRLDQSLITLVENFQRGI